MLVVELGAIEIDYSTLDKIIHNKIPSGFRIHEERKYKYPRLQDLYCFRDLKDTKRFEKSIGTLGGGNHFIEIGEDSKKNKFLIIHSGSRNLGKQVADHYQKMAIDLAKGNQDYYEKKQKIISHYKETGRKKEIKKALKELEREYKNLKPNYPKDLCFLTGKYREMYLQDMKICQDYASTNRVVMGR